MSMPKISFISSSLDQRFYFHWLQYHRTSRIRTVTILIDLVIQILTFWQNYFPIICNLGWLWCLKSMTEFLILHCIHFKWLLLFKWSLRLTKPWCFFQLLDCSIFLDLLLTICIEVLWLGWSHWILRMKQRILNRS